MPVSYLIACLALLATPAEAPLASADVGAAVSAEAKPAPPSTLDARLSVSQLLGVDDLTDRTPTFTEIRGSLDAERPLGLAPLELHVDARGRLGWNDETGNDDEITRLYLQLGHAEDTFKIALGRQTIGAVSTARVDGASVGLRLSDELSATAFGGLAPHPLLGDFNVDFATGGAGYEYSSKSINHAGGAAVQLFQGDVDRVYLTERMYTRIGTDLSVYGHVIVDLFAPRGVLADLGDVATEEASAVERLDLTNATLNVGWRTTSWLRLNLLGTHNHTIIPKEWLIDFVEQQRRDRGFVVDGLDPIGTRRTSVSLTANVDATSELRPYAVGRFDVQHDRQQDGYEARLGLKYDDPELGFVDLFGSQRRFFGADAQLGSLLVSATPDALLTVEAGGTVMRTTSLDADETALLYDVYASLWLDLGQTTEALEGVRLLAQYQVFIDPDLVYQIFYGRLAYRLKL